MSVFQSAVGGLQEIAVKITGSAAVDIVDGAADGGQAWNVPWLCVGQNNGTSPGLTVALYDGSTSYYLGADGYTWNALAVYPGQALFFRDIVVPKNWKLRVISSSASGLFDVTGTKIRRVA